ncbi:hypothetical protein LBMAG42_52010 [Deltaproteobacteria bacterium]|nr:hypothetical protein LBMAG42_52010 [Deltaproteobacteria bacterium]
MNGAARWGIVAVGVLVAAAFAWRANPEVTLDREGRVLTWEERSFLGGTVKHFSWHDESGNLIRDFFRDGEYYRETAWTYDGHGRMLSEHHIVTHRRTADHEWTYDDAGNILTDRTLEPGSGSLMYGFTRTYDESGNVLTSRSATRSSSDAYPDGLTTYTYDCHGRRVTEDTTFTNGTATHDVYTYDRWGTLSGKTHTDADGTVREVSYGTFGATCCDAAGKMLPEEAPCPR